MEKNVEKIFNDILDEVKIGETNYEVSDFTLQTRDFEEEILPIDDDNVENFVDKVEKIDFFKENKPHKPVENFNLDLNNDDIIDLIKSSENINDLFITEEIENVNNYKEAVLDKVLDNNDYFERKNSFNKDNLISLLESSKDSIEFFEKFEAQFNDK